MTPQEFLAPLTGLLMPGGHCRLSSLGHAIEQSKSNAHLACPLSANRDRSSHPSPNV
jgi:hypothetical protein